MNVVSQSTTSPVPVSKLGKQTLREPLVVAFASTGLGVIVTVGSWIVAKLGPLLSIILGIIVCVLVLVLYRRWKASESVGGMPPALVVLKTMTKATKDFDDARFASEAIVEGEQETEYTGLVFESYHKTEVKAAVEYLNSIKGDQSNTVFGSWDRFTNDEEVEARADAGYFALPLPADPRSLISKVESSENTRSVGYRQEAAIRSGFNKARREIRRGTPAKDFPEEAMLIAPLGEEPNTTLLEFRPGDRNPLFVGQAGYGSIMATHDCQIEELQLIAGLFAKKELRAVEPGIDKKLKYVELANYLPWREKYRALSRGAPVAGGPAMFFHPGLLSNCSGIGLASTLVEVSRDEIDLKLNPLYVRRSDAVGTYPNFYHVVPAGMFNTKEVANSPEYAVFRGMASEFLEECRGRVVLEKIEADEGWLPRLHAELNTFIRCAGNVKSFAIDKDGIAELLKFTHLSEIHQFSLPNCKWRLVKVNDIVQLISIDRTPYADGQCDAHFVVTQLAFDFMNCRPEVCFVCLVDGGANIGNWEVKDSKFYGNSFHDTAPKNWVRSGLACYQATSDLLFAVEDRRQGKVIRVKDQTTSDGQVLRGIDALNHVKSQGLSIQDYMTEMNRDSALYPGGFMTTETTEAINALKSVQ